MMDVISSTAEQACLNMDLSQPSPPTTLLQNSPPPSLVPNKLETLSGDKLTNLEVHTKLDTLDSATYLGAVSTGDSNEHASSFLQYVDSSEFGATLAGGGAYPGAVYVAQSAYSTLTANPTSTSPVNQFYDTSGGGFGGVSVGSNGTVVTTAQSQLVSYAGSTFLIQPGPDGTTPPLITPVPTRQPVDQVNVGSNPNPQTQVTQQGQQVQQQQGGGNTAQPLSYATRVSPATIQWLVANYETAEDTKQDPVNAASFGKLIRSVFLGLRTRRIGTRGNSKYHYYGIRVKPTSVLNGLEPTPTSVHAVSSSLSAGVPLSEYLGQAKGITLPSLSISREEVPEGLEPETINIFTDMYRQHLTKILDCILNLNFYAVEQIWFEFWRLNDAKEFQKESNCQPDLVSRESLLKLFTIVKIQNYVQQSDYAFYQALVDILLPDVLRPIPASLTQGIRNFAKSIETWLSAAMADWNSKMKDVKMTTARAFSQTLRRYTSLNHLAQVRKKLFWERLSQKNELEWLLAVKQLRAARAVLQNNQQITQMLTDLNKVDFSTVQDQASWVCGCSSELVFQLEKSFKDALSEQSSLEGWSTWMEGVVDKVLKVQNKDNFVNSAKQFLLRWSFYSSMIIRDLTLRSAASFGSFHLIRLLYDEYMFYAVENRVAQMLDLSAIAVMDTLRSQNTVQKPLSPTTTVGYSPVTALKSMPAVQTTNHNGLNSNLTNGITGTDQLTNGMSSSDQITNGMSASDQLNNGMGENDEFQSCDLPTVLPSPPQLAVRTKDLADNNGTLTTIDNDAINNSVHGIDILHQTEQIKKDEEKEQKENVRSG